MRKKKLTTAEKLARAEYLLLKSGQAYENRGEIFRLLFDCLEEGEFKAAELLCYGYEGMEITEQDSRKAFAYLDLSKDPNNPEGLYVWAEDICLSRPDKAIQIYKKSADLGYDKAMFEYGRLIYRTSPYVGFKYILKAADLGYSDAMFEIAMKYAKKYNLHSDIKKAFKYMKMAAEKKCIRAYFLLGYMFEYGKGTRKCYKQAHYWFNEVVDIVHYYDAQGYLGLHMIYGHGTNKDVKKGIELLTNACDFGVNDPLLYVELGKCYERGIGVAVDKKMADHYYNLSKYDIEKSERL